VERFCKAITDDYDNTSIKAPINTIGWLNELLKIPNLYDILYAKKPDNIFARSDAAIPKGHTRFYEAESYRDKEFSDLSEDDQNRLKKFNRLVLELHYPDECPQTSKLNQRLWDIAVKKVEIYLCPEHTKHLEELEPKKQGASANTTIFFDKENRYLWINVDKKERLEPKDSMVFGVIVGMLSSRPFLRIEEVISSAYQKEISRSAKVKNIPEYNRCKSAISTINTKYRKLLEVNDKKCMLIMSEDERIIKFSKPVVLRSLLRK
jgi:hypothetical protein